MVMTMAKITAGDGYTYLTRHVANGDATPESKRDATAYYTAQGNPPGRWIGRGAHLIGLQNQNVTEQQMRDLFGQGEHPNSDAMVSSYLAKHVRGDMTERQLQRATAAAIRHATLGTRFPAYQPLSDHDQRVTRRQEVIREETGREPTTAEVAKVKAEEARRQRTAVAGWDLVFSPVKSAALLWALDDRAHVREAIRAAHYQAMAEALDLLEDHAIYTRTGRGGIAQLKTNGLIAAAFEHWDSRAGDPNLHTHVAVSSKVQGVDGKWRSLDSRALHRAAVAISEAYNTAFELHLTASLGVTFTARPDTTGGREPVREIDGVPFTMIEFFSQRRAAIEKRYKALLAGYRADHGHEPPAAVTHQLAQQANLETRHGKKPPRSLASKRAQWRAELEDRFGRAAVAHLKAAIPAQRPAAVQHPAPDLDLLAQRAVASVASRRSTWTMWNIRAEAERLIRTQAPGLGPGRHREIADTVTALALSPKFSMSVEAPALLDEPPELRRADGESVFTEHHASRFTSQAVLDAEQRLLNATCTPAACALPSARAGAALDGFEAITSTKLDNGQHALITAFACDERLLLAGIGPAGAGKTTAMRAYAHVLRQHGRHLIPLATSAAAAAVLGKELGAQADNLHKFIHEWTEGRFAARLRAGQSVPSQARPFALRPGDVVLVDEAGMAGTFLLDQLVQVAASRGAVVRLLGDDRQLPAVESGGALRLIASQPSTPELSVLYRFRDPNEAATTLKLRVGDAAAVDWYASNDRIRGGSREAMTQAAYAGWKADMLAGKITLMAAATNATMTELSAQARADRVQAGQVEHRGTELRDGNRAGQGDWIVTRQNNRRMSVHGGRDWVKNGDAWHVQLRHPDASLTVRNLAHGGSVRLPYAYVRQHVELLYATTAHRAQGATVDTAHPLITAHMTRETLYVLASRAREKTTLYVATHDAPYDEDDRTDQVRTDPYAYAAREVLLNIIATESAPLSATETITAAQEEAGSLATLVPRYQHGARQQAEHRYVAAAIEALGKESGSVLVSDPAWSAVVLSLHDAEADGWDPARLLALAGSQRELDTADSLAEVLAWRIDAHLASNPAPPTNDRPYETARAANDRLAEVAKAAMAPQMSQRAQAEFAWPALLAALHRAEYAGLDPAELLSRACNSRDWRNSRSISETLALRINRSLGARTESRQTLALALLPWMASQRPTASRSAITRYLDEAADLIATRVNEIASTAVRHRPAWMHALGQPPDDPEHERRWLHAVAIIAAYREQFAVTTDDSGQPLGPYAESSAPAHKPYWHAAESLLTACRLAGLDAPANAATPGAKARVQLAIDIYRALPQAERTAITTEVANRLGSHWLGNPDMPDEDAATQPAHAAVLVATLTEHGHMMPAEPAHRGPVTYESAEEALSRHAPSQRPIPTQRRHGGPGHPQAPAVATGPRPRPLIRPVPPAQKGNQQRP